jgi:hypothetical protein
VLPEDKYNQITAMIEKGEKPKPATEHKHDKHSD